MATIHEAAFTVSWTTVFPSLLAGEQGRLTRRAGYAATFDHRGDKLGLPWHTAIDRPSWSRFWSSYLGAASALRELGLAPGSKHDSAWEHLVPFQMWHRSDLRGPVGTTARSRVLLYPAAVSVIIGVRVSGTWPMASLADAVAALYAGTHWGTAEGDTANRSLRGIASDLRKEAAALLTHDGFPAPEPGPDVVRTVAAPIAGAGNPAEFDLGSGTVQTCVAGLAGLGPPGPLNPAKLVEANSDTNLGARVYVLKKGHALWNAGRIRQPLQNDPLGCLVRNHTDLVAHVEAVGGMLGWAGDRAASGAVLPVAVHPLLRVGSNRLRMLHSGNASKTYRSDVARLRIEPFLPAMDVVDRTI
ncbi:hypothetical protein Amsp01_105220 [Amycolatopsis sp. NBRC 101858]|uniref:hypothetical protein n=1 Tax=Amycolatopsis sp. NBRC 101858 TaxID=3032200 RepID=UPI0024A43EF3|nr:hypothetical protein [Amycolatopsis sp. NBRC 101858]GLY44499.1 hypothetical protein Amsp01_105220 [Amycolatopsis sp. NBRC 101858]